MLALFVVTAGFTAPACPAAPSTNKDCPQTAPTQSALDQCAGRHYRKARERRKHIYRAILEAYAGDPVFTRSFEAAHKAWVAYRDATIEARFPPRAEVGYYGSVLPMCEALYRERLARARIKQLLPWL